MQIDWGVRHGRLILTKQSNIRRNLTLCVIAFCWSTIYSLTFAMFTRYVVWPWMFDMEQMNEVAVAVWWVFSLSVMAFIWMITWVCSVLEQE